MSNTRYLIKGATALLTMDPGLGDLRDADVLIEGTKISAVGVGLEVDQANVEVIDATDRIVLPGFHDTHRHTWESQLHGSAADWTHRHYYSGTRGAFGHRYLPEDQYIGNLLGICEALDGGTTTMLDWSHNLNTPEHADAAVEALTESGARAVFAYGGRNDQWLPVTGTPLDRDAIRVREKYFSSDDQLVTMCLALRGPDLSTEEAVIHDWALAKEMGMRISVHVGGTDFLLIEEGKRYTGGAIAKLNQMGLLEPGTTYIHCNRTPDDELRMIAESGGTFSISPEVEMGMEMGFPITGRLMRLGYSPSLSVDVPNALSASMFGLMRATLQVQRALDNEEAIEAGALLDEFKIDAEDVVRFATIEGARANALDHKVGSLTPGKEADLILVRTDDLAMTPLNHVAGQLVMNAHPGLVDTVFVAGRLVKRNGRLLHIDVNRLRRLAIESRDRLYEEAGHAVEEEFVPEIYHGQDVGTAAMETA